MTEFTPTVGRSWSSISLLAVVSLTTFAGCGTQEYEARLAESEAYFRYRQKIDEALEPKPWQARQFPVSFRPPKGFQEIPGPPEEETHDPRQPPFIRGYQLPGLLGAWQGQVRVEIPGVETDRLPGFLFMCTNHSLYLEPDEDNPPEEFQTRLLERLGPALGFDPPSQAPWPFNEVRAPRGSKAYVPRKTYEWVLLDRVPCNINDQQIEMDFRLFRYPASPTESTPVQMILVSVLPQASMLDPRERVETTLEYAMEQLTLGQERPQRGGGGPTSGGGF